MAGAGAALCALLLTVGGCDEQLPGAAGDAAANPGPATARVTGSLNYVERTALTDRALAEITLEEVSRQDAPAEILARQRISDPGQVPIRYQLEYDPARIDPRLAYAVRARISDRGRLMFISDSHTPVLTRGAGRKVNLVLTAVPEPKVGAGPEAAASMPLRGLFRYFADAALFRDCRTDRIFPVAMEGAYIELERAYLTSGIEPASELLVELQGRYLERPAIEGNQNEISLIVDKLDTVLPEKTCQPEALADLRNTKWDLLAIEGKPVVTADGRRAAHMVLSNEGGSVRGHAGCNDFFGAFRTEGDSIEFSALGSTMKACPTGNDSESALLRILDEANRYRIRGEFLYLYHDARLLARFEAVYL